MDSKEKNLREKVDKVILNQETIGLKKQLNTIHDSIKYGTGSPEIDEAIQDDAVYNIRKSTRNTINKYKNGNKNN